MNAARLLDEIAAGAHDLKARGLEINAADLSDDEGANVEYLPLLGAEGFIRRGWSHLLSGYPKSGKTETMVEAVLRWPDLPTLYVTEESLALWAARFKRLGVPPDSRRHITLVLGRALSPEEIVRRIEEGGEAVIVLDTLRRLAGWRDDTANAEIERTVSPILRACRDRTSIFLHHVRKGGGEDAEGIAGGHALAGLFDCLLELGRVTNATNRRRLRGWARVLDVPEVLIEKGPDGRLAVLGDPRDVSLVEIKGRLLDALSGEWRRQAEIVEDLDDPKPSGEIVRRALRDLAVEGRIERDPPLSDGSRPGARYLWRLADEPHLLPKGGRVGGEVSAGAPEPPLQLPAPIVGGEVPACRTCGGRRYWRRTDLAGARPVCSRCRGGPPGDVPVEWIEAGP